MSQPGNIQKFIEGPINIRHWNNIKTVPLDPLSTESYGKYNLSNINSDFPNSNESLTTTNKYEKKLQEVSHKIYQKPSYFPSNISLISNDKEIDGVDSILSQSMVEKYGKMERRVELLGCNFKIIENEGSGESLYRAISQAITGDETSCKLIQNKIFEEITVNNYKFYKNDLVRSYIEVIPSLVNLVKQKKIIKVYHKYTKFLKGPATTMELHAAGTRYGFNFGIIILWKNTELIVVNCNDPKLVKYPIKFYFFLTGKSRKFWHYELLLPIGNFIYPPDGKHPVILKQAIIFPESNNNNHYNHNNKLNTKLFIPYIPDHLYQIIFATNEGEFLYHDTKAHNLFEILSQLFFDDINHGDEIKNILDEKRTTLDYMIRPKIVREHTFIVPGSINPYTTHNKLHEYQRKAGDITYLKLAACEFKFSTIGIGTDRKGNFYKIKTQYYDQKIVDIVGKMPEVPWYYFFIRNSGHDTTWHLLHKITSVDRVLKNIQSSSQEELSHIHELYDSESFLKPNSEENYEILRMEYKHQFSDLKIWDKSETTTSESEVSLLQKEIHSMSSSSLYKSIRKPSKALGIQTPCIPSSSNIGITLDEIYVNKHKLDENPSFEPSLLFMDVKQISLENIILNKTILIDNENSQHNISNESILSLHDDELDQTKKIDEFENNLSVNDISSVELLEDIYKPTTLSKRVKRILNISKNKTRNKIDKIKPDVKQSMLAGQVFTSSKNLSKLSSSTIKMNKIDTKMKSFPFKKKIRNKDLRIYKKEFNEVLFGRYYTEDELIQINNIRNNIDSNVSISANEQEEEQVPCMINSTQSIVANTTNIVETPKPTTTTKKNNFKIKNSILKFKNNKVGPIPQLEKNDVDKKELQILTNNIPTTPPFVIKKYASNPNIALKKFVKSKTFSKKLPLKFVVIKGKGNVGGVQQKLDLENITAGSSSKKIDKNITNS